MTDKRIQDIQPKPPKLRPSRELDGTWSVICSRGQRQASGFDNEQEAWGWINEANN